MRALIQRVAWAKVEVAQQPVGSVARGLMILLGVGPEDSESQAEALAQKVSKLRIFNDEQGKMNLSVRDIAGAALVVSQFTLYADCRKGNRPSFVRAAAPDHAEALYQHFVHSLQQLGIDVATGRFATHMQVSLCNDGPVTIWLDSEALGL